LLASELLTVFANTSAVLECFQKDGPKGDRYVILKICLQINYYNPNIPCVYLELT
jgi:hypothetical protein